MCFAPQRRSLFRHLSFQKWSEHDVFCTFWLPNVLRATAACNFSSLIWPDGFAPAAFKSVEKYSVSRLSYHFAHLHLLSSDSSLFCSSLLWLFPPLLFHLSILSEVWLLNFLRSYPILINDNDLTSWPNPGIMRFGFGSEHFLGRIGTHGRS